MSSGIVNGEIMNTFYFLVTSLDCLLAIWYSLNGHVGWAFTMLGCAYLVSRGIK